jgi:hypothetical protein
MSHRSASSERPVWVAVVLGATMDWLDNLYKSYQWANANWPTVYALIGLAFIAVKTSQAVGYLRAMHAILLWRAKGDGMFDD